MDSYKYRIELYYRCHYTTCYTVFNEYLKNAAKENLKDTILIVLHIRDIKHGLGLRDTSRHAFQWLMFHYPKKFIKAIEYIPIYGRWDDLYALFPRKTNEINKLWISQHYQNVSDEKYQEILQCQQKAVMIFINQLKKDYEDALNLQRISYASKWALNEKSSLNRQFKCVTVMCDIWGITKKEYRQKIVFLRKYLNIPEHHICENNFRYINYYKLSTYTIQKYKHIFTKKDYKRFAEYITFSHLKNNIVSNNQIMYPFDIVMRYNMAFENDLSTSIDMDVEKKWDELVKNTQNSCKLNNTMIIGDISGSMYQQRYNNTYVTNKLPINIALSMMILSARCIKQPYANMIISNSNDINYTYLRKDETLLESLYKLTSLKYNKTMNIYSLLNYILQTYNINNGMTDRKFPNHIIFISDKSIKESDPDFINNIDKIKEKYHNNNVIFPSLIYINLDNSCISFNDTHGILEITGFSYNLFKQILSHGEINPVSIVNHIISKLHHNNLLKYD